MKRGLVMVMAGGQLLLALLFGGMTWHFCMVQRDGALLEADAGRHLLESERHVTGFMRRVRRNAAAVRKVGESLNRFSGRKKWGDPMLEWAGSMDDFTGNYLSSERGNVAGRTGTFLLERRPLARTMRLLTALCGGIAAIFLINAAWCGIILIWNAPPDRQ